MLICQSGFCVIGGRNYSGYPGAGDPRQRPVGPDPPADGLSGGIFAVIYRRKGNTVPFGTVFAHFLRLRGTAFVYAVWQVTTWWEWKTQKPQNSRICRGVRGIAILVLAVIVWNQCADMTKWFYIDKQKYDAAVKTVDQIALDLERDFDTSKPVIFTGNYEIPYSIIQDAYVNYGTTTYLKMKRITDLIDPNLLDKYNRGSKGVWVSQTPALSVIDWGRYAFDSDAELVRFLKCTDTGWWPAGISTDMRRRKKSH